MVKLSTYFINGENPRQIKDEKFRQLMGSLHNFPQMMELRPIVVDENNMVLGGKMRYRALVEMGVVEVPDSWIKRTSELTADQKREFIIKDNATFGAWDWDILADTWEAEQLEAWGLDIPDLTGKKKVEFNASTTPDFTINLVYNSEENYNLVKNKLAKIAATPEEAIWKLLTHWDNLKLIDNGKAILKQ